MSAILGVLLIVATLALVGYPFFTASQTQSKLSGEFRVKRDKGSIDEELEAQISKLRRSGAGVCGKCGAKNPADARFCRLCGTGITGDKKND